MTWREVADLVTVLGIGGGAAIGLSISASLRRYSWTARSRSCTVGLMNPDELQSLNAQLHTAFGTNESRELEIPVDLTEHAVEEP